MIFACSSGIKLWLTFLKFPMKSIIWHDFVATSFLTYSTIYFRILAELSPKSRFCHQHFKMSPTLLKAPNFGWLCWNFKWRKFVFDSFILIISHFNKQIHVKREMASWLYFSLVLKVISGSPTLDIQFERTGVKILWLNSFNFAWFRNTFWSLLRFLPEIFFPHHSHGSTLGLKSLEMTKPRNGVM